MARATAPCCPHGRRCERSHVGSARRDATQTRCNLPHASNARIYGSVVAAACHNHLYGLAPPSTTLCNTEPPGSSSRADVAAHPRSESMVSCRNATHASRGAITVRSSMHLGNTVSAQLLQRNIADVYRLPSGQHVHDRSESAIGAAATATERCNASMCATAWRLGRGPSHACVRPKGVR